MLFKHSVHLESIREELRGSRVIDLVENVKSEKFQSVHHFISMNNFRYLKIEEKHGTGLFITSEHRPPTGGRP